nr:MAG TPA: hypothetical protein [Caudoviricetes sp.]DAP23145.1 MAG TPA: hypothetical protein [Caudoviricetes sp.]
MIWALHQPAVAHIGQLLATFIAEVPFFDDLSAMRAGCHFFILHSPHPPFLSSCTSASSSSRYSSLSQPSSSQTMRSMRMSANRRSFIFSRAKRLNARRVAGVSGVN